MPVFERPNRKPLDMTAQMIESDSGFPVPGGFGLYVHWPFCESKCPYCDFNSHVSDSVDQAAWRAGLLSELDHYGSKTEGRRLDTVFFGGGTPSMMPTATAAAVLDRLSRYWVLSKSMEVTLEANPSSVEARKLDEFRKSGINRVSLGVQSFSDADLRFLGRTHSAADARNAIAAARQTFDRVSFDLIYALPGQGPAKWARQLEQALSFGTDHLSLYQLTIEKGTAFYSAHKNGAFAVPDEDLAANLYMQTHRTLEKAGLEAYEVSNYAIPGSESLHNLVYWRGGDYVGIGPGAHGRLSFDGERFRTEQIPLPTNWLISVDKEGHASRISNLIPRSELIMEQLLMGMRLSEGVDRKRFARITGAGLEDDIDCVRAEAMIAAGLIELTPTHLRATQKGRLRLNAVIEALVPTLG